MQHEPACPTRRFSRSFIDRFPMALESVEEDALWSSIAVRFATDRRSVVFFRLAHFQWTKDKVGHNRYRHRKKNRQPITAGAIYQGSAKRRAQQRPDCAAGVKCPENDAE